MDAAKIVIGMVDRNHVAVILKLLGKGVREPRGASEAHPVDSGFAAQHSFSILESASIRDSIIYRS